MGEGDGWMGFGWTEFGQSGSDDIIEKLLTNRCVMR